MGLEEDLKNISNNDQMLAAVKQMAGIMGQYHKALMKEDFTRQEAIELCLGWQSAVLMNIKPSSE